ncbi:MAG: hypothetical protein ACOZNI_32825 [Myxococcota bacterium]
MLIPLLAACAFHATGLVEPVRNEVILKTYEGERWVLVLGEDGKPVRYLDDATVAVDGRRLGKRVFVRDWWVADAGDGSSGFVGVVRRWGARLVIDDRNTKTTLGLDDVSSAKLWELDGKPVLVQGHVVGGGIVEVMRWRVLEEGADGWYAR